MKNKKRIIIALVCLIVLAAGLLIWKLTHSQEQGLGVYTVQVNERLTSQTSPDYAFPWSLQQVGIEIESIGSYDGLFVEDGSDRQVEQVMAIQVRNITSEMIEYGIIELKAGEQTYQFEITGLLPEDKMLVLEKNAQIYQEQSHYETGECVSAVKSDYGMQEDVIQLSSVGDTLIVTNLTNHDLTNVRVCYKNIIEGDYYSGITYRLTIPVLEANASSSKKTGHYGALSKIIYVEYDQ